MLAIESGVAKDARKGPTLELPAHGTVSDSCGRGVHPHMATALAQRPPSGPFERLDATILPSSLNALVTTTWLWSCGSGASPSTTPRAVVCRYSAADRPLSAGGVSVWIGGIESDRREKADGPHRGGGATR